MSLFRETGPLPSTGRPIPLFGRVMALLMLCSVTAHADQILYGAGASFPYPLYSAWFKEFAGQSGIRIAYTPSGSGDGIRQFIARSVDFGASDVSLSAAELESAGEEVLQIPMCMGAVVIIYNLPGVDSLRLTPRLLADIFSGEVTTWHDKRIARINEGTRFPRRSIAVVHRTEGSGTTSLFTGYLSGISSRWRARIGTGRQVTWPVGMGVEGNGGVVALVQRITGAIGYVELSYAVRDSLAMVSLQNGSGQFVLPSLQSVTESALPLDTSVPLATTPMSAADGYPITSYTYLLVYSEQAYGGRTIEQARALQKFLLWAADSGQIRAPGLLYGRLPGAVALDVAEMAKSITYNGYALEGER